MPKFTIVPSPIPDVVLTQYDAALFPKFSRLFLPYDESSPLRYLLHNPDEAATAIVLENRSPKEITALRYRWQSFDAQGKIQNNVVSTDSYLVEYRPVVASEAKLLITQSKFTGEGIIDHVLAGGGLIGGRIGQRMSPSIQEEVVEFKFEIDLVLFADGEIAGPDPEKYAFELNCRKLAAEFVATQIRMAEAEERNVRPVLSALAALPNFWEKGKGQQRALNYWIRHHASLCLRVKALPLQESSWHRSSLRNLESCQALPKFYRRETEKP